MKLAAFIELNLGKFVPVNWDIIADLKQSFDEKFNDMYFATESSVIPSIKPFTWFNNNIWYFLMNHGEPRRSPLLLNSDTSDTWNKTILKTCKFFGIPRK